MFLSGGILFRHNYAKFGFGQPTQSFIITQKPDRYFLEYRLSGKNKNDIDKGVARFV